VGVSCWGSVRGEKNTVYYKVVTFFTDDGRRSPLPSGYATGPRELLLYVTNLLPRQRRSYGVVASVVRRMNEVTVHWARLVLGWVTVFGRVYHHGV